LIKTLDVNYGEVADVSIEVEDRDGYTFDRWYTDSQMTSLYV
jgi:hypothetical protein